jgi:hypothetical protein
MARTKDLPLMIPVSHPNAELMRGSIPDPHMSLPIQPQKDCTACMMQGLKRLNPQNVQK